MNAPHYLIRVSFLMLLLCIGWQSKLSHAQTPPATEQGDFNYSGVIKGVSGKVTLVTPNGMKALSPGDRVNPNDRIITGEKSAAGLVLRDGTVLTVGSRTWMDIKSFQYNPNTQEGNIAVQLIEGTMRMITGTIAKLSGQSVQVITNTSTIGPRGTDFIVESQP